LKLDELTIKPVIKALVFGRIKTGKTAGAATFPRPRFMEFDNDGWYTLKNPELEAKYGYSKNVVDVKVLSDITDKSGVVQKHTALDQASIYFDECMKPANVDSFDTWVIDTATSLFASAMNKGVILLGTEGKSLGISSNTWESAKKHGLLVPKKQDYGAERSMAEQFIDMVLASGKHVLLLAHEREQWDDNTDKITGYVPLMRGQSTEVVPSKFSEVWNLRTRPDGNNVKRYLQTKPDALRACGSRLGLPDETPFEWQAIKAALKF
jgi:hypothetical protein